MSDFSLYGLNTFVLKVTVLILITQRVVIEKKKKKTDCKTVPPASICTKFNTEFYLHYFDRNMVNLIMITILTFCFVSNMYERSQKDSWSEMA